MHSVRAVRIHRSANALDRGLCDGVGRVGGDAQDVNAPGGDLHDEEDIETSEEDGLHVHEIAGEQRVGL
ncbi:hypothetical protein [Streptomyces sp. NPDC005970]|uniref:hypothetical protein n=1 Tax=Streptomyces sp. NPDC005970 TaxID=3156723 RepID=UPI0033C768B5